MMSTVWQMEYEDIVDNLFGSLDRRKGKEHRN